MIPFNKPPYVGKEEQYDDHLMWQETGRNSWIGTPHVNISIGYVFPQRDAEWKRAKAIQRSQQRSEQLHHRDSLLARERYVRDSLNTALKMRKREAERLLEPIEQALRESDNPQQVQVDGARCQGG